MIKKPWFPIFFNMTLHWKLQVSCFEKKYVGKKNVNSHKIVRNENNILLSLV